MVHFANLYVLLSVCLLWNTVLGFFRILLWPWFTLQIYIISLCGSCVSKIFWLRQKMGSYVGFCLQSWMMWTWIGRSVVRFGIWIGARMAIFCKQSDVSSDRKVVSERLELRRRIQICRYCNPFLSAPTPSQDEERNTKKQSKKKRPFAWSFSDLKISFFGD